MAENNVQLKPVLQCSDGPITSADNATGTHLHVWSWSFLDDLRSAALAIRTAPRTDVFEACAVLSSQPVIAKAAYAETLMKCLGQTLEKPAKLHRPHIRELSFDEAWLLRTAEMALAGRWDSFEFLIRSRIPAVSRRSLGALIVGITKFYA